MNKECFECGKEATEDHHVIPQSLGGTKTVPLCGSCHDRVHGWGNLRRDNHKQLTKIGLQKAKDRGVILGNNTNLQHAQEAGRTSQIEKAISFAKSLEEEVLKNLSSGKNLSEIASLFNEQETKSSRGGKWTCGSISRLLDYCKIEKNREPSYYQIRLDKLQSSV